MGDGEGRVVGDGRGRDDVIEEGVAEELESLVGGGGVGVEAGVGGVG